MAALGDERPSGIRVDTLRTKRAVARAFFAQGSPRVITFVVAVAVAARLAVGATTWGWADVAVVGITVLIVGPVEWVLHTYLLHAGPESWARKTLGTGSGHQQHHLDPPAIEWLLLRATDARQYSVAIGLLTAAWSAVAVLLVNAVTGGGAVLAPVLTAILCAYLALGHYEWTHLLVHTRYRVKSRYYRRLARNHRRHHYRNEAYWMGITSNLGDRIFGTYPQESGSVPLSDTARTLETS